MINTVSQSCVDVTSTQHILDSSSSSRHRAQDVSVHKLLWLSPLLQADTQLPVLKKRQRVSWSDATHRVQRVKHKEPGGGCPDTHAQTRTPSFDPESFCCWNLRKKPNKPSVVFHSEKEKDFFCCFFVWTWWSWWRQPSSDWHSNLRRQLGATRGGVQIRLSAGAPIATGHTDDSHASS